MRFICRRERDRAPSSVLTGATGRSSGPFVVVFGSFGGGGIVGPLGSLRAGSSVLAGRSGVFGGVSRR